MKNIPQEGFFFNSDKHAYYFDGKKMTGVTTILGVLAKPALIAWASKCAVDYIEKAWKETTTDNFDKTAKDIFLIARKAYTQKRDKAADIGTQAHSLVETYIKTGNFTPTGNKQIDDMVMLFIVWAQKEKVKFLASEKIVYSKELFYAGTLDFICKIENKIYLGDLKTGSGIYQEMWLQTAGYQLALQECEPEIKIDGHIIVNITKDGKLNVKTRFDFEASKEGFLSALKLYRLLNNYE